MSAAKYVPAVAGTAVSASPYRSATNVKRPVAAAVQSVPVTQVPPIQSSWRGSPFVYPSDSQSAPLRFPSSTAVPLLRSAHGSQFRRPTSSWNGGGSSTTTTEPAPQAAAVEYNRYNPVQPVDVNSIAANAAIADDDNDDYNARQPYRRRTPSSAPVTAAATTEAEQPLYEQPLRPHTFRPAYRKVVDMSAQGSEPETEYDGVSFVRNGFKYYLPRHYHEEQSDSTGDTRAGSFGYVDPFGIRRVVYYNTAPGTGFVHRKNNRYVGLGAEPYDPRPQ